PTKKTEVKDLSSSNNKITLEEDRDYVLRVKKENEIWWKLQVFVSQSEERAKNIMSQLENEGYEDLKLVESEENFKVQLGRFSTKDESNDLAERLENDGWSSYAVKYEEGEENRVITIYDSLNKEIFSSNNFILDGEIKVNGDLIKGESTFQLKNSKINLYHEAALEKIVSAILSSEIRGRARLSHPRYNEALKSQAIVIRTKILNEIINNNKEAYSFDCFNGYQNLKDFATKAVDETEALVISYDDEIIDSYYHQNSGGATASAFDLIKKDLRYLESVEDKRAIDDPLFLPEWSKFFSEDELITRLEDYYNKDINGIREIEVLKRSPTERAVKLAINTDFGRYQLDAEEILHIFEIENLKFDLNKKYEDGYLTSMKFSGIGSGLGLGLSQDGAQILAREGKSYNEIIHNYYQDVQIKDLKKYTLSKELLSANIVSGLDYKEFRQYSWDGQKVITLLEYNPDRSLARLDNYLAGDKISSLANLNEVIKEKKALAGVNGGYYNYSGRPLGLFITNGQIVTEDINGRAALAKTTSGDFFINRVEWKGELRNLANNKSVKIDVANKEAQNNEIAIYTHHYGEAAPLLKENMSQMIIENNKVTSIINNITITDIKIPENGFILQSKHKDTFSNFKKDDEVEFEHVFNNPIWNENEITMVVGGGPMLIENAKVNISSQLGDFKSDIVKGRAPRSSIGIKENGNLLIFTVDGRQEESIGISLEELAHFMLEKGVIKGMNLDGGASARMTVRGFTMNNPSTERLISNALIFYKKEL
ncbi:MAG: SpoIID/LytB domain-containing protein, partial [Bacillota bacterium]